MRDFFKALLFSVAIPVAACLLLVFLILLCIGAFSEANGQGFGVITEEHIIELPEDGSKWYLSVFGSKGDPKTMEVLKWTREHAGLKKLRGQVHFATLDIDSPTFKERYAPGVEGTPMIRLQNAKAAVIYEAHGDQIPYTSSGLYSAVASAVNSSKTDASCPWRDRKRPKPDPKPPVDPDPVPIDDGKAPVLDSPTVPDVNYVFIGICLGVLVLSCVAGAATQYAKEKFLGK